MNDAKRQAFKHVFPYVYIYVSICLYMFPLLPCISILRSYLYLFIYLYLFVYTWWISFGTSSELLAQSKDSNTQPSDIPSQPPGSNVPAETPAIGDGPAGSAETPAIENGEPNNAETPGLPQGEQVGNTGISGLGPEEGFEKQDAIQKGVTQEEAQTGEVEEEKAERKTSPVSGETTGMEDREGISLEDGKGDPTLEAELEALMTKEAEEAEMEDAGKAQEAEKAQETENVEKEERERQTAPMSAETTEIQQREAKMDRQDLRPLDELKGKAGVAEMPRGEKDEDTEGDKGQAVGVPVSGQAVKTLKTETEKRETHAGTGMKAEPGQAAKPVKAEPSKSPDAPSEVPDPSHPGNWLSKL